MGIFCNSGAFANANNDGSANWNNASNSNDVRDSPYDEEWLKPEKYEEEGEISIYL